MPNPAYAETELLYDCNSCRYLTAVITDITGRPVQSYRLKPTDKKYRLDVSKLVQGTYFLLLSPDDAQVKTVRLIVIR